jgi:hypothetical protein
MKVILAIWLFITLFPPCNSPHVSNTNSSAESEVLVIDILNKVYLFGPSFDSTTSKVEANCDCCTSSLAFLKDSTFIYISYCLEGDNYSKGKYSVDGKQILLHFDSLSVTQSFGFVADTSYQVSKASPSTSSVEISSYKSMPVLVHKVDGVTEYGIEDGSSNHKKLIDRLKADSIWQNLNLSESKLGTSNRNVAVLYNHFGTIWN